MKKNRKGFTLVELIICIAIVAAITLAATLGLQKVLKGNKVSTYKNDIRDIAASTKTYLSVKRIPDSASVKSVYLDDVVKAGYISDDFYDKTNGLLCTNFSANTEVFYQTVDGIRKIYLKNDNGTYCDIDNIDNCTIQEDC